jgi:hypothetical protein
MEYPTRIVILNRRHTLKELCGDGFGSAEEASNRILLLKVTILPEQE